MNVGPLRALIAARVQVLWNLAHRGRGVAGTILAILIVGIAAACLVPPAFMFWTFGRVLGEDLAAPGSPSIEWLRGLDAHTPFPIEELPEILRLPTSRIRPVMLACALVAAGFAFWLQWHSAVQGYPINSGGRPLNSWPVFLMPTFEAGILFGTFGGIVAFLVATGLPRLHHPAFTAHGFERASQDRFFLSVADPAADADRLSALLDGLAPLSVREVAT